MPSNKLPYVDNDWFSGMVDLPDTAAATPGAGGQYQERQSQNRSKPSVQPGPGLLSGLSASVPPWTPEKSALNFLLDKRTMADIDWNGEDVHMLADGNKAVKQPQPVQDQRVNSLLRPGVPYPQGDAAKLLECLLTTNPGLVTAITSTHEAYPGHVSADPHMQYKGVDVKTNDPQAAMAAGALCGAIFQLDEYSHPSSKANGPHVHLQTRPGLHGATGPYNIPVPRPRPDRP